MEIYETAIKLGSDPKEFYDYLRTIGWLIRSDASEAAIAFSYMKTLPLKYVNNNKQISILQRPILTKKGYNYLVKTMPKINEEKA